MRVAIVTESFLPHMNGVTGSVLQILRHLERTGHDACVIAPADRDLPEQVGRACVEAVPSVAMPGYRSVRVGASGTRRVASALERYAPDVVHLASPFALGWSGVLAAGRLDLPTVAVYQTDVAAYASRYGVALTSALAARHIGRLHRRATMTLVPSSESEERLARLGVDRMRRWARGVDSELFHPARRDDSESSAVRGVVVGYVGRLAPEKQVEDLRALDGLPDVRLVIVGDGPSRPRLEALLPYAEFRGHLTGEALAAALASFDVFVHPGESETFGQTLQEAHASGVPVVATGRGGPRDLVRMGIDGWLYRPGDLDDLRMRVADLVGDGRKRRAFGRAGREAVETRSWTAVGDQLLEHFDGARTLHGIDRSSVTTRVRRPELPRRRSGALRSYVSLGDSLTEGLCDTAPDGSLRGWADRLALLLAARGGLHYANLAIRSQRVSDICEVQLPRARALRPDLVSILVGANDLVKPRPDIRGMVTALEGAVAQLRDDGADVLLVTPFLPRRREAALLRRRFAEFASELVGVADRTGAILLDTDLHPVLGERRNWGEDLVHLSRRGHRFLAYRAAGLLGVPHAEALGLLDESFHEEETALRRKWWRRHALPWILRRMRGRRAGDGRSAKHDSYVFIGREQVSAEERMPER